MAFSWALVPIAATCLSSVLMTVFGRTELSWIGELFAPETLVLGGVVIEQTRCGRCGRRDAGDKASSTRRWRAGRKEKRG